MAFKLEGLSVSLPLTVDLNDGPYKLNKTVGEVIKQNFKNLILTSSGERIMMPDFGVGLRRFLFEGITPGTNQKILTKLHEQVQKWMPFIALGKVSFIDNSQNPSLGANQVVIRIEYSVGSLNLNDTLNFTEEITN